MAKKKSSEYISHVRSDQYLKKAVQLAQDNYSVLMPGDQSFYSEPTPATWADFIGAQLRGAIGSNGQYQRRQIPALYFSSGNEIKQGTEKIGSPDLGYMEWGFGNVLPNLVAFLTHLLPYTAAGIKFNTDLCAGLGPQPMYDTAQYVGGNITTRYIRYKDAGTFLRGQIIDKQRELLKLRSEWQSPSQTHPDGGSQEDNANSAAVVPAPTATIPVGSASGEDESKLSTVLGGSPTDDPAEKIFNELCASLEEQISELQKALETWKTTSEEVQAFLDRNNIAQTWLSLVLDQELFGIAFPELLLNQQAIGKDKKPVETEVWTPKVIGIAHRSCHTTRLERMDDEGHINFVYCSNRWLDRVFVEQGNENDNINAIPAIYVPSPLDSLDEKVREARQNKVSVENRPTHFVLPTVYPTAGRPYYPTPAWHSIFGGDIYEYISTIISDRLNRKRNSNIIGRVIYLNNEYMQQLFVQKKATGNDALQKELRDKLYHQINQWLANRNNAGQSLLAFTFTGADGKEHKSFEIVEIEAAKKSTADANEKETAEIGSIVFMAMGLDARLLGSTPLALVGSNGGTDIRERYLLRLLLKSPAQNILLKPFEVLSRFNEWDKHLVWQVQREVMTTLDRSKSGVTSQNTENESQSKT